MQIIVAVLAATDHISGTFLVQPGSLRTTGCKRVLLTGGSAIWQLAFFAFTTSNNIAWVEYYILLRPALRLAWAGWVDAVVSRHMPK